MREVDKNQMNAPFEMSAINEGKKIKHGSQIGVGTSQVVCQGSMARPI